MPLRAPIVNRGMCASKKKNGRRSARHLDARNGSSIKLRSAEVIAGLIEGRLRQGLVNDAAQQLGYRDALSLGRLLQGVNLPDRQEQRQLGDLLVELVGWECFVDEVFGDH